MLEIACPSPTGAVNAHSFHLVDVRQQPSTTKPSQAKHLTIINKRVVCDFRRQLSALALDNLGWRRRRRQATDTVYHAMCVGAWKKSEIKSAGWQAGWQAYIFIRGNKALDTD